MVFFKDMYVEIFVFDFMKYINNEERQHNIQKTCIFLFLIEELH